MLSNDLSASSAVRPMWPAWRLSHFQSRCSTSVRAFAQPKDVAGTKDHATINATED